MRLGHTDLLPVLAIIAGGAVGAIGTGFAMAALSSTAPSDDFVAASTTESSPHYTVAPRVLNVGDVRRAMFAAFPKSVREGGVGGTASVDLFIDERGEVQDMRIGRTSGHVDVDQAALNVAGALRFSPALNGEQPVAVWFSRDVTFAMR